MKILIASDLYWPYVNGNATFTRNLVKGLIKNGHTVWVLAPSPDNRSHDDTSDGYAIKRIRSVHFPFYPIRLAFNSTRPIKKIIAQFNPDVIHVQGPMELGRTALLEGKKHGIPVVATSHAMPENLVDNLPLPSPVKPPADKALRTYGIYLYNKADFVTFPTQSAIDLLADSRLKSPYVAVSNGIDTDYFRPGSPSTKLRRQLRLPDKPILLYVGRLDGEKHLSVWLEALVCLRQKIDAHGLIIGKGTAKSALTEQAAQLGIADHVTFTGFVKDELLPEIYRLGTVFAITAPVELQSIATLEAAASSLPIVAVNASALPELCFNDRNGYLFELDDSVAMAQAIEKIMSDPELRQRLGRASRKLAISHSLDQTILRYEAIYRQLLAKKASVSQTASGPKRY